MSESAYIRASNVVSADMDGEPVIMSMEQNAYFGISGIGAFVWELLDHAQTVDDMVGSICARFDVSAETCRRDVAALLQDLERNGLIRAA